MSSPSISVVNWLEAIEQRLAAAPIISLRPIAADVPDPAERDALAPVVDQFGLGPASLRNLDLKSSRTSSPTEMR